MTRPPDQTLLEFLEGTLDHEARGDLLDRLDRDSELAADLRRAARGLAALRGSALATPALPPAGSLPSSLPDGAKRFALRWALVGAAASLVVAVPVTLRVAQSGDTARSGLETAAFGGAGAETATIGGIPEPTAPSFVLTLHGRWPDAGSIDAAEVRRRAEEYWGWTTRLAEEGRLVAAGDLRFEPGERVGPGGVIASARPGAVVEPDFLVGMYALRAATYEDALAIARESPHVRYGGSISVRRVGMGFVTVPGMDDWASSGGSAARS